MVTRGRGSNTRCRTKTGAGAKTKTGPRGPILHSAKLQHRAGADCKDNGGGMLSGGVDCMGVAPLRRLAAKKGLDSLPPPMV